MRQLHVFLLIVAVLSRWATEGNVEFLRRELPDLEPYEVFERRPYTVSS